MLSEVVNQLVHGSYRAWAAVGTLWLVTLGAVLAHRRGARPSGLRVLTLLALTAATSTAGLAVASAVAIPRLRWVTAPDARLALSKGDTWRTVRGPAVLVDVAGEPDLAVPSIDADGRWILFGLLSGEPVPGAAPAPETPPSPGSLRICESAKDTCRAWPSTWPDPSRVPASVDLGWSKDTPLSALAFDVESDRFLTSLGDLAGPEGNLELIGRVSNDPPRDVISSLFIVRRLVRSARRDGDDGSPLRMASRRLQAMRVVSVPAGGSYTFLVQRSDVSLGAGPLALRLAAQPLLAVTMFSFPLALVVYLMSPLLLALRRRPTPQGGAPAGLLTASAARAWIAEKLHPLALFAAGLSAAAPGLVAIASLLSSR